MPRATRNPALILIGAGFHCIQSSLRAKGRAEGTSQRPESELERGVRCNTQHGLLTLHIDSISDGDSFISASLTFERGMLASKYKITFSLWLAIALGVKLTFFRQVVLNEVRQFHVVNFKGNLPFSNPISICGSNNSHRKHLT